MVADRNVAGRRRRQHRQPNLKVHVIGQANRLRTRRHRDRGDHRASRRKTVEDGYHFGRERRIEADRRQDSSSRFDQERGVRGDVEVVRARYLRASEAAQDQQECERRQD